MLTVLLVNAATFSQNLRTNKDSVLVSVEDLDKSVFKMIENKEIKELLINSELTLKACNGSIKVLDTQNLLLRRNLDDYRAINSNLAQTNEGLKKIAKNEKSHGLRRGFWGFIKGFAVASVLGAAYVLTN